MNCWRCGKRMRYFITAVDDEGAVCVECHSGTTPPEKWTPEYVAYREEAERTHEERLVAELRKRGYVVTKEKA